MRAIFVIMTMWGVILLLPIISFRKITNCIGKIINRE